MSALVPVTIPLPLWATSLTAAELKYVVSGLTDAKAERLARSGQVTRFLETKNCPQLVPNRGPAPNVETAFATIDHTVGVEALFIMNPGSGTHAQRMSRWYNVLRSISTMKGITYYSVTHARVRVLVRDSYDINNPKDQDPLPVTGERHVILRLILMPYEDRLLSCGGVEVKTVLFSDSKPRPAIHSSIASRRSTNGFSP